MAVGMPVAHFCGNLTSTQLGQLRDHRQGMRGSHHVLGVLEDLGYLRAADALGQIAQRMCDHEHGATRTRGGNRLLEGGPPLLWRKVDVAEEREVVGRPRRGLRCIGHQAGDPHGIRSETLGRNPSEPLDGHLGVVRGIDLPALLGEPDGIAALPGSDIERSTRDIGADSWATQIFGVADQTKSLAAYLASQALASMSVQARERKSFSIDSTSIVCDSGSTMH